MHDDSKPCRYDWLGIHEEMLRDKVRVEAYRNAIWENRALFEGRRVLDVGCGTGILSIFAAKAGAAAVYAVDREPSCVEMTRRVAEANGFAAVVHPILGSVEDIELPVKADILISEWMGYFLLFENMLDAVLLAQEKHLVPGGLVLPTVVDLYLAPFTDVPMAAERERFWSDVSGVDLSVLLPEVLTEYAAEPRIEGVGFDQLLAEPICIWHFDFRQPRQQTHKLIQCSASWRCPDSAICHGYVGWFDCHFEPRGHLRAVGPAPLPSSVPNVSGKELADLLAATFKARFQKPGSEAEQVDPPASPIVTHSSTLSTAPGAPRTHWHQTLFFLREPIAGGTVVDARFTVEMDASRRGWVLFSSDQKLGPCQDAAKSQSWLLRTYAQPGLQAPPLPTARTWLYGVVEAGSHRRCRTKTAL